MHALLDRRRALGATLALPAALALATTACAAGGGARYTIPAERLQQALAQRFPRQYPLGGLAQLVVATPRLQLRPERNRLATELDLTAEGGALPRAYAGALALEFGLRYEPADRTVRAQQPELLALRLPGAGSTVQQLLAAYAPALVRDALHDVVLHQLEPSDLALADGLGLRPDALTVTPDGLRVDLVPQSRGR